MRVRFWGVRGSLPTPATGDEVASRLVEALLHLGKHPAELNLHDRQAVTQWVRDLPPAIGSLAGGNTPCVEMVTEDDDLFIIDFGSGLRALGNSLMDGPFGHGEGHAHLFLSHLHWDHIQGWPFFRPGYKSGNQFDLYARHEDIEAHLQQQQKAPFFPPAAWGEMDAKVRYHQLSTEAVTLCEGRVRVSSLELEHPSRAYAYRFEADNRVFIYASDGAFPDPASDAAQPFIEFFHGADLLIFDAQFTLKESIKKRAWGHSSPTTGVELACWAGAKQVALFHHDPNATEAHLEELLAAGRQHAQELGQLHPETKINVFLAREGMEVEL